MNDNVIDRATQKIDIDDFRTLTQLHQKYEWLQEEPDALFELWCLTENEEQKKLIKFLINNFLHINGRELSNGCKTIAKKIEDEWKLAEANTFLSATCDNSHPDGSQMLIQQIKNKFSQSWRENMFYNSLPVAAYKVSDNSNIILIDDFIGTGDTILRKVKYLSSIIEERKLQNISIYIASLAAMNFAKEALDTLKSPYFSVYWLDKGISEKIEEPSRTIAIKDMEFLESKLKTKIGRRKLPNFGYKKSESLFAIESNNIPNNVFPIFWWPSLKDERARKTLFRRV